MIFGLICFVNMWVYLGFSVFGQQYRAWDDCILTDRLTVFVVLFDLVALPLDCFDGFCYWISNWNVGSCT